MAYMFGNVDEFDETAVDDSATVSESTALRREMQAVFVGCIALAVCVPWLLPVSALGGIVSGAVILATQPAAECQRQVTAEIERKRFGCAWLWWLVMAAIICGALVAGLMIGSEAYMKMRGL